ncbi:hypothetical protein N7462_007279 [Penicillium macrosclerotiorum]|uniref:uncharacterized protein n=1 Tax=Penicillium macrosclerotiorum TaxID=303699 RepID=UPI00254711DB|nr:uncharacterized protein N7462_007279 [Penicillium macrosclerotiorum]KAJ5679035.1 hypothetical protein N7462_007279 [Penicillium macrosclerotiorum]
MSVVLTSVSPQNNFSRGPHWNHESPFLPFSALETKPGPGAPSLKELAIKCLFKDQSILKPELFQNVPWMLAKKLWEYLENTRVSSEKRTLLAWKIFSINYPKQFNRISPSYTLRTAGIKKPLKGYIEIMKSDSCDWRAVLSLPTLTATTTELVEIGSMRNLVALELAQYDYARKTFDPENPEAGLTNGIVRTWVEMAKNLGSLQHLQFLRIENSSLLTPQALWMLEELPCLQLVTVSDCKEFTSDSLSLNSSLKRGKIIGGWNTQRLSWLLEGQEEATLALRKLDPILHVYESLLAQGEIVSYGVASKDQATLGSDTQLMQFELQMSTRPDKNKYGMESRGGSYRAKTTFFFTRISEQNRKKRELTGTNGHQTKGKRVMKQRKGRDMTDLLGEFLT